MKRRPDNREEKYGCDQHNVWLPAGCWGRSSRLTPKTKNRGVGKKKKRTVGKEFSADTSTQRGEGERFEAPAVARVAVTGFKAQVKAPLRRIKEQHHI